MSAKARPQATSADNSVPSGDLAGTTVLAFDFGERRIGVAVGDLALKIAHPLSVIDCEDNRTRFARIAELIETWHPRRLVVGIPGHADGSEHEIARLARRFSQRLDGRFGIPVDLVDEQLTSAVAEARLRESGVGSRRRRAVIDAVAAQEILRTYLEGRLDNSETA